MINEKYIREMVEILDNIFSTHTVVKFHHMRKSGITRYPGGEEKPFHICLPLPKNRWYVTYRLSLENLVLHEFTHVLEVTENKTSSNHGAKFYECLKRVIKAWYGNIDKYQWNLDYGQIKRWYEKEKNNE